MIEKLTSPKPDSFDEAQCRCNPTAKPFWAQLIWLFSPLQHISICAQAKCFQTSILNHFYANYSHISPSQSLQYYDHISFIFIPLLIIFKGSGLLIRDFRDRQMTQVLKVLVAQAYQGPEFSPWNLSIQREKESTNLGLTAQNCPLTSAGGHDISTRLTHFLHTHVYVH